jgi:hypothetical protein
VIAEPPLFAGTVQFTVAEASPARGVPMFGALGAVAAACGVTDVDFADAVPSPFALVAITSNVYDVPFVRPVTSTLVAFAPADVTVASGVVLVPAYARTL